MMGAPIDALDDRIGGPLQFVIKPALDKPAEHRLGRLLTVQGEAGDIGVAPGAGSSPVHGLDDVAADAELAQRRSRVPASMSNEAGPTCSARPEPFELRGAAEHQPAQLGISASLAPGRRSATPPPSSAMSRSARSRLVQRSASTSVLQGQCGSPARCADRAPGRRARRRDRGSRG